MNRYCLGPVCRDLTPVRAPRAMYCAACQREMRRQWNRNYRKRYAAELAVRRLAPARMEQVRVASLAWYHRNAARANARRRAA